MILWALRTLEVDEEEVNDSLSDADASFPCKEVQSGARDADLGETKKALQ